ncbi:MAG TPA: cytochrome P460 family protein [Pelomicrobium sp.]|nr:cytochrome P460 family protein [Pelomicrobium sp.]
MPTKQSIRSAIVPLVAMCAAALAANGIAADMMKMPKPDAEAVKRYLTTENYRSAWKFFPGKQALYKGVEPHGLLLTTYVNPVAYTAISVPGNRLPHGSIIVKENYTPDKKLAAVTVMYKVEDFNPEHNNWYWLKYLPDGKVEASGKVASCQGCHAQSKNDYVMTPLPKPK